MGDVLCDKEGDGNVSIEDGLNKVGDEVSIEDRLRDVEISMEYRLGDRLTGSEEVEGEGRWEVNGGEGVRGEDKLGDKNREGDNSDRGDMVEEE